MKIMSFCDRLTFPRNRTNRLFAISSKPSLNQRRFCGLPNFSLYSSYGCMSFGARNALNKPPPLLSSSLSKPLLLVRMSTQYLFSEQNRWQSNVYHSSTIFIAKKLAKLPESLAQIDECNNFTAYYYTRVPCAHMNPGCF